MTRECVTYHHACDCRETEFVKLQSIVNAQQDTIGALKRKLVLAEAERDVLRQRIESAPVAIMDTRDALGICAPTEEDFPALYALQGKRVRPVVDDM